MLELIAGSPLHCVYDLYILDAVGQAQQTPPVRQASRRIGGTLEARDDVDRMARVL